MVQLKFFHAQKCRQTILCEGLKPRHLWRHFWHPKNPLSVEVPVKLRALARGRALPRIFMITRLQARLNTALRVPAGLRHEI